MSADPSSNFEIVYVVCSWCSLVLAALYICSSATSPIYALRLLHAHLQSYSKAHALIVFQICISFMVIAMRVCKNANPLHLPFIPFRLHISACCAHIRWSLLMLRSHVFPYGRSSCLENVPFLPSNFQILYVAELTCSFIKMVFCFVSPVTCAFTCLTTKCVSSTTCFLRPVGSQD